MSDSAPGETIRKAQEALEKGLRLSGAVWIARLSWQGRSDVEFALLGEAEGPTPERLDHAARCLASLDTLVEQCGGVLDSVPEGQSLFPPRNRRRWRLEGISFEAPDPTSAQVQFTQEEPEDEWEYHYVLFLVELKDGRPSGWRAEVR